MSFIPPGRAEGSLEAPASKSMMQRAVAAATLTRGATRILNPSWCEDARAALRVAEALGARIVGAAAAPPVTMAAAPNPAASSTAVFGDRQDGLARETGPDSGDELILEGGLAGQATRLDCGESGLCLRMFAPVAALTDRALELFASGSLATRPMEMIEAPLRALGARCLTNGGRPPVRVQGPLLGGQATLDGSISSQLLTGLLLALPLCPRDSELRVEGLRSKPYVRMTLRLLRDFGIDVGADAELTRFEIPGRQVYRAGSYRVEGDWSGAAFPLVAGAITGSVEVRGLDLDSPQADRAIVDALRAAGVRVDEKQGAVRASTGPLTGFEFDATECPDLFPPLVALACSCPGLTVIRGAGRLRHKESDRASALVGEFSRLGGRLERAGDTIRVWGGRLQGGAADSRGDHRIAMALAVAALGSHRGVELSGEGCVAKSYPDFFARLDGLRRGP